MTPETKNEIFKSLDQLAEIYGISAEEIRELLEQNAKEIAELREYRKMIER